MVDAHQLLTRLSRQDDDEAAAAAEAHDEALAFARFLIELRDGLPGAWADEAACRGSTEVMFPGRGVSHAPAHALCAGCGVLADCSAWVAALPDQQGIAAGTDARQRAIARRGRAA